MTYVRHRTSEGMIERVQDRVEEAFQQIDANFTAGAVFIADVELLSTETVTVNHGLGYAYRGFIVVRSSQPGVVTDSPVAADVARRQIKLDTTVSTTVSLLIF